MAYQGMTQEEGKISFVKGLEKIKGRSNNNFFKLRSLLLRHKINGDSLASTIGIF
jgi:hypothetical protein